MPTPNNSIGMLSMFTHPVFLVKDGIITEANQQALDLQIPKGKPINQILDSDKEEYGAFSGQTMSLTVILNSTAFVCAVVRVEGCDIFHILSSGEGTELRAMALASQHLRDPLTNIMALVDALHAQHLNDESPKHKKLVAQLQQNLHRVMRTVGNMSDTGSCASRTFGMETMNVPAVITEALEKSKNLLDNGRIDLQIQNCSGSHNGVADRSYLERAVFNLISNAVKYSPADSTIHAKLQVVNNKVQLTVENDCPNFTPDMAGSMFFRYRRSPSVTDGGSGLGLGIPMIQAVAAMHKGSVLLTMPKPGKVRFCLTIPIRNEKGTLRSPVLHLEPSGGYDHSLIELSDILPEHYYE